MLGCMTEPPFTGDDGGNSYPPPQQPGHYPPPQQPGHYPPLGQYQQPGQYPPPGAYPPPVSGYPPGFMDPAAPYGRHPMTGEPLSEKSKIVAGLLQLLGLVGLVGIGRLYLGYTGLGLTQLLVGLIGGFVIGLLTCGVGFLIPVIWGIVDAVLILTDKVRDADGRPLRDGT